MQNKVEFFFLLGFYYYFENGNGGERWSLLVYIPTKQTHGLG